MHAVDPVLIALLWVVAVIVYRDIRKKMDTKKQKEEADDG